MVVNSECAIRHYAPNLLSQDAQHLHNLNTVMGTIRWLVTSAGQYAYIWVTDKYHENILEEDINVNCTTIMQDVGLITDRTILAK